MDRSDLLNNINGIGEMVVDSLCRSHACPLLASVEFRARNTSAANHFVNQLYNGRLGDTNSPRVAANRMLWTN
jgi:hypothetical protein